MQVRVSLWALLSAVLFATGCGGGSKSPDPTPQIRVSISPATTNLLVSTNAQFTASVEGASNTAVNFSVVQGTAGGQILNSGDYLAPKSPGVYTVRATSVADPTRFADATVTVRDYGTAVRQGQQWSDGYDFHTASLLNDGTVLIVGGSGITEAIHKMAHRYVPDNDSYQGAGQLNTARMAHVAFTLPDGKVVVAGGFNLYSGASPFDPAFKSTEIYDPALSVFTPGPDMTVPRRHHVATQLKDSRVLITGGIQLQGSGFSASPNTEIYDPATNAFTAGNRMTDGRWMHTATLLADGKVLIAGGRNNNCTANCPIYSLNTAEIFDPAAGTFTPTGSMKISRYNHTATLLDDGRVLILGGETTEDLGTGSEEVGPAEIYDPATGQFTKWTSLVLPRSSHSVTLLNNGKLWVVGGLRLPSIATQRTEYFDPATGISVEGPQLAEFHARHSAVRLSNGKVLIFAGSNGNQPMPNMEILE
ncbi:MAG TPA: kelch repeat-containing protein [Terriglobales bacterium]|nr:kelch repeat-containing protein [Terriglobales bacterium]